MTDTSLTIVAQQSSETAPVAEVKLESTEPPRAKSKPKSSAPERKQCTHIIDRKQSVLFGKQCPLPALNGAYCRDHLDFQKKADSPEEPKVAPEAPRPGGRGSSRGGAGRGRGGVGRGMTYTKAKVRLSRAVPASKYRP